jgi:hypothetical protein
MKSLLMSLLIASAALASSAADAPSVAGDWQVHLTIGDYDNTITCSFVQKDQMLSGKCNTTSGPSDVTGKISGNKVSWSYQTDYQTIPITVVYDGVLDSDHKIAGTVGIPKVSADGSFTATQSK